MLVEVYVDGASRGQGTEVMGEASCGIVIYKNRKLIGSFARGLGKRTNNEAEYEAVLNAIMMCWAADLQDPIIYSDSKLVVNQVNGSWSCDTVELLPYLITIQDIREVFRFRLQHVPRREVNNADWLANEFLDKLSERMGIIPKKKRRLSKGKLPDDNTTQIA